MQAEIADDGRRLNLGRVDLDWTVWVAIFARLDRGPTQMVSVLLAFSCRRRDLHHELMSSAQRDKRECSVSVSSGRQLSWNWVSSAYIRDFMYGVLLQQIGYVLGVSDEAVDVVDERLQALAWRSDSSKSWLLLTAGWLRWWRVDFFCRRVDMSASCPWTSVTDGQTDRRTGRHAQVHSIYSAMLRAIKVVFSKTVQDSSVVTTDHSYRRWCTANRIATFPLTLGDFQGHAPDCKSA